jgi:aminoglycoside phosphotransferase family enzyme
MNDITSVQSFGTHTQHGYLEQLLKGSVYIFKGSVPALWNALLVYLSEQISYRLTLRFSPTSIVYPVEKSIESAATKVIFLCSTRNSKQQICIKLWQPCANGLYDTLDRQKRLDYLLEGLELNSRFAPGVCYGVAPIVDRKHTIQLGNLISKPDKVKLNPKNEYALVMKRLDESWRLDEQLKNGFGRRSGIKFIAREVAAMHRSLDEQPQANEDNLESIRSKLLLNLRFLNKALDELRTKNLKLKRPIIIANYERIGSVMYQAFTALAESFGLHPIRRCHGDLKAGNLWIRPANGKRSCQLLALDCVDFNPAFCFIDTLSDVAMLAVDIEALSDDGQTDDQKKQSGQKRVRWFLNAYLEATHENDKDTAWMLLEFYLTEKAIVHAYMNIVFDGFPIIGLKYLNIALKHAEQLEKKVKALSTLSLSHTGTFKQKQLIGQSI